MLLLFNFRFGPGSLTRSCLIGGTAQNRLKSALRSHSAHGEGVHRFRWNKPRVPAAAQSSAGSPRSHMCCWRVSSHYPHPVGRQSLRFLSWFDTSQPRSGVTKTGKMLMKEYRICMPLTVEEVSAPLLYILLARTKRCALDLGSKRFPALRNVAAG